jgi:transcription antitermination factor NusG
MVSQWHAAHVASRTEKKVAERLEKNGITVYLPIQKQLRQWSDRKKWVDMVVLSGYVFVKINKTEQLKVLQIPGVSRFLKHYHKLVCIPDLEMERFRDFIEKAENRTIEFTAEKPPIGTQITIQTGTFKGRFGEIIEHKGKRKITVAVQLEKIGYFLITLLPEDVLQQL